MDDAGLAGYRYAGYGTLQPVDEGHPRNYSTDVVCSIERTGEAWDDNEDRQSKVGEVGSDREGMGRAADTVQLYRVRIEMVRFNSL